MRAVPRARERTTPLATPDYTIHAIACNLVPTTTNFGYTSSTALRFPVILGFGAMAGATVGAFAFTGGKLSGYDKDPNVDEYERKEAMRLNRRRPVEETLAEVGEGRGRSNQQPPGYLSSMNKLANETTLTRYLPTRLPRTQAPETP